MYLHANTPPEPPRPPARRSRGHAGRLHALSAVTVVAIGLIGLRSMELPGPEPVGPDGPLKIELVQPSDTEIRPGALIDVGELVNGFQGVPAPPPAALDEWAYQTDWDDWAEPPPPVSPTPPWRAFADSLFPRRPAPEPAAAAPEDEGRWFGFDAPGRDYRAEREARRARLEAMERQPEAQGPEQRRLEQAEADGRAWERREIERRLGRDEPPDPYGDYDVRDPAPVGFVQ
ncbi:MAG TPA: hypothetical protein VEB62_16220 [Brevundimonas sp.]|nr:hypothetical protein [Brevundimonas sp.]